MSSTAPEPLLIEVQKIDEIRDDENRFPPTPVATIKVNGMPHEVTLDAETMRIDHDAFTGVGLPSDYIDRINDALEDFQEIEQIEPSLTQAGVEDQVAELSQLTGEQFDFRHVNGDQYELRKLDEQQDAWVREGGYNSLSEAYRSVQELVSSAAFEPIISTTPGVDPQMINLDLHKGPIVESVDIYPPDKGGLPSAEVMLGGYKHDQSLQLDPETMRVDVDKSHAPNFDLTDKALKRIHDEIDQIMEAQSLEAPINEHSVGAIADGLDSLTGQSYDFRKAGDQYELRKRDENDNWQQVEQYENLTEAYQDVTQREAVAQLEISDPARARAMTQMVAQLDRMADQPAVLDMTPDVVEPVHAGIGDVTRKVKDAVAAGPLGKPHGANGQRLSAEVVDKTLALMLKQLDAEDEKQVVAVKR